MEVKATSVGFRGGHHDPRAHRRHSRPVHPSPTALRLRWPGLRPRAAPARPPHLSLRPPTCPLPPSLHPGCCAPAFAAPDAVSQPPPRPHALDSDAPTGASPPAFASATAHPSSGILDTKRASTPTHRPVTHLLHTMTLTPQPAPVLLRALTLSSARPLHPDADQPVSSISHC
jgi:hypothetical protein